MYGFQACAGTAHACEGMAIRARAAGGGPRIDGSQVGPPVRTAPI